MSNVSTLSARIEKISICAVGNQSQFALKLRLLEPVGGLEKRATCYMSIYSNYLAGRHDMPRLALASSGDIIDIFLMGLEMRPCEDDISCVFAEFTNIESFRIHTPKVIRGGM